MLRTPKPPLRAPSRLPWLGETRRRHLQPTCLALLSKEPASGYDLLRALRQIPVFGHAPPDAPGLYRALQLMERRRLIKGRRVPPVRGPARRVYTVTPAGRAALTLWLRTLRAAQADLALTIRLIQSCTRR